MLVLFVITIGILMFAVGALAMVFSYLALAENRGVFRFVAYDHLSMRGKRVWKTAYLLVACGFLLAIYGAYVSAP